MGNYMLCRRSVSKTPFYIESVCLNIYSIEELCFFLKSNLALAYDVVVSPALAQWLSEECRIKDVVKGFASLPLEESESAKRIYWILEKSKCYTENELKLFRAKVERFDMADPFLRRRRKADALVKYGKYKRGIECYESLLNYEDIPEPFLLADVYYNMGVAFTRLFLSGRALECFIMAYECGNTQENLKACLHAAYFDGGKDKLLLEAEKLGVSEKTAAAALDEAYAASACDMPKDAASHADEWIRTYHMNVDD